MYATSSSSMPDTIPALLEYFALATINVVAYFSSNALLVFVCAVFFSIPMVKRTVGTERKPVQILTTTVMCLILFGGTVFFIIPEDPGLMGKPNAPTFLWGLAWSLAISLAIIIGFAVSATVCLYSLYFAGLMPEDSATPVKVKPNSASGVQKVD